MAEIKKQINTTNDMPDVSTKDELPKKRTISEVVDELEQKVLSLFSAKKTGNIIRAEIGRFIANMEGVDMAEVHQALKERFERLKALSELAFTEVVFHTTSKR